MSALATWKTKKPPNHASNKTANRKMNTYASLIPAVDFLYFPGQFEVTLRQAAGTMR